MKYGNYKAINKLSKTNNWSELCIVNTTSTKGGFMNEQLQIEERLWDYIDGLSSAEEKTAIEKLIAENLEWKRKYSELLEVNQVMSATELDEPSMRFSKNVMEEIAKYKVAPATRSYFNKKIIWGIGGIFVVMLLGFLIFAFSQVHLSATDFQNAAPSKYDISKVDWSKFFNSGYTTVFMLINVVLGLVLLDMYLQRKKNALKHKDA
ncbi:MAG: hypothetical protein JST96_04425 [Bacteroidetes bacterium]|nr:hypothetical protein [Bacteroidota bacterium]